MYSIARSKKYLQLRNWRRWLEQQWFCSHPCKYPKPEWKVYKRAMHLWNTISCVILFSFGRPNTGKQSSQQKGWQDSWCFWWGQWAQDVHVAWGLPGKRKKCNTHVHTCNCDLKRSPHSILICYYSCTWVVPRHWTIAFQACEARPYQTQPSDLSIVPTQKGLHKAFQASHLHKLGHSTAHRDVSILKSARNIPSPILWLWTAGTRGPQQQAERCPEPLVSSAPFFNICSCVFPSHL